MEDWLELPELVDRVQELLDVGLYDEARGLLDRYGEIYKDDWEIPFLYSRICAELDRPRDAIEYLNRSLRLDTNNLDCLLGLFYSYTQIKLLRRGFRYLLRAERLFPHHDLVINALIWYYTESGDFRRAIAYFETNQSILENNPDALRNAGIAFERTGDYEKASQCFTHSLEIAPQLDEVRDLLADLHMMHGNTEKSIALYQEHLTTSPQNIKTLSRLTFCLSQSDRIDDAKKLAGETIRIYPNSPVGYVDLAYVNLNNGEYDAAIAAASRAQDVAPLDAEALRVKAIAYSEQLDFKQAEELFQKALELEPRNTEILRDYYHHLREAGSTEKMEQTVFAVIEQEKPYCMEDFWFLADFYRMQDRPVKAFHYLNKAFKSMPGEKELLPPMADILLEQGHISMALPFLQRYVESRGWNDIMEEFQRHYQLRSKRQQEGLRFLRFHGQKPPSYRDFVFSVYFRRYLTWAIGLLAPCIVSVLCLIFPVVPVIITAGGLLAVYIGIRYTLPFIRFQRTEPIAINPGKSE